MSIHHVLGIYKRVGAFIAPSRYMAEQMKHFAPARGRIHHIPSFVDQGLLDGPDPLADAGTRTTAQERPYMLYFGRVSADKGLDVLLRAADGLDRDVDLVIAGESKDGYLRHLQDLSAAPNVANVRFVGFVEGPALSNLIRDSLCVVAPSIWHDNAPMSVYESLAHGKAVIGSDLGGISEQLEDGAGILIPAGDPEALRQAMQTLVDQPTLRHQFETTAYQRAVTTYTPERHYERVMAVFEALLHDSGTVSLDAEQAPDEATLRGKAPTARGSSEL